MAPPADEGVRIVAPAQAAEDAGLPRQLTVLPIGHTLPVPAGSSLLQAALAAGLRLPSSCRNGSCRHCIARLVAGRIGYRMTWPGLLAEEKAEGWILPCVALAETDVVIEAPAASPLFG